MIENFQNQIKKLLERLNNKDSQILDLNGEIKISLTEIKNDLSLCK